MWTRYDETVTVAEDLIMSPTPSLRRKLPLLVSALLCLVVLAVSWSAYQQIENVLISASGARLTSVTLRLADLLAESTRRLRGDARALATDSTVERFLSQPTVDSHDAAARRLERARAQATQPVTFALWSGDRHRLLVSDPRDSLLAAMVPAPSGSAGTSQGGAGGDAPGGSAWISALVRADTGVAYATVAPVLGAGRDTLGFVVAFRRLRGGPGAAQLAGLIGSDATVLVGNATGGLWTDLSRPVAGPPDGITPGEPQQYTQADGTRLVGVAASIRGTPWMVWVQVPRRAVLAAAKPFVLRIAAIGLLFIALGAVGAWMLIRRLTAPLEEVTRAAEDLARGDYTRRVPTTRRDELGRLAASFNSMAAQVDTAARALRSRADELEAANRGLLVSEERHRRLIEAAHEGICAVDGAGIITYANRRLADMLGHHGAGGEELSGRSIFEFMDAETAFDARTRFARQQRGIAETREVPFRRQDGSTVWTVVSVSPLPDGNGGAAGGVAGALFMLADVTERQAAEERVRSSERQFRALIENASDMISILDANGRQRYVSPAQERFIGYSPAELQARNGFDLVHPDDADRVQTAFARLLQTPRATVSTQYRYQHKNGTWRELSSIATNLLDDPDVGGIVVNSHDVTEQRALEAQLRQAQKMEAVGQLAGGVAHDFNNLLTVVTSYSLMLLSDLPADDPARADVEEIRAAADRAARLTRQLLAFSRQQVLEPRVLDLNAVVHSLEKMLRRVLPENVRPETALAPRLGRVFADPGQLEQVIVNLALNARDAMPDGGALTIETADVELDEEYVRLHPEVQPGRYVMLAVSDSGTGMNAATQARIFEPFFTTKAPGAGTGLGLSTVYGIVRQSGGHVWVYSEPGVGSTFKVYLPLSDAHDAASPRHAAHPGVQQGAETVLLVEDDAQVRAAAFRILSRAGYRVLEASSGPDALRLAEQHAGPIDVLLTDMVMPEMSGRELADRFLGLRPETGLAIMSGYTEDAALRQGSFEPGTVFIAKPFTPQTLTAKLREALDGMAGSVSAR
jgi:PAS domain S-box-containing protein